MSEQKYPEIFLAPACGREIVSNTLSIIRKEEEKEAAEDEEYEKNRKK
jgi:hypothetical protein